MRSIWKFPLIITDKQIIEGPIKSVLHVGLDPRGYLCLWAEVDTADPSTDLTVYIVGTGNTIPDEVTTHYGSVMQGSFIWHVYG